MKSFLKKASKLNIEVIVSSYILSLGISWLCSLYIALSNSSIGKKSIATILLISWFFYVLKNSKKWSLRISLPQVSAVLILISSCWFLIDRSIMFKGDEGFHIQISVFTIVFFKNNLFILISSLIFFIMALVLSRSKAKWILIPSLMIFIVLGNHFISLDSYQERLLFRWPLIQYFLTYPLILLNSIFEFQFSPYQEWVYRIIPFVSFVSIGYVASLTVENKWNKILVFLFFLTLPLIQYYGFIFYEEPLALLMFFCALIRYDEHRDRITSTEQWMLMISIVLKDSFLLYVLIFLALDYVFKVKLKQLLNVKYAYSKIKDGFFIIVPGVIFKFFQETPYNSTGTTVLIPDVNDLLVLVSAITEQYVTLIAIVFLVAIFSKRLFSFEILLFSSISLFYLTNTVLNTYLGYSRYSLVLVAILLSLLIKNVKLNRVTSSFVMGILLVGIVLNIYRSPFRFTNSELSMLPKWGDYKYNTSEFWYEYDSLYSDLQHRPSLSVAAVGRSYFYYDTFYHFKYDLNLQSFIDLHKVNSSEQIKDSLKKYNPQYIIHQKDPLNFSVEDSVFKNYSKEKEYIRGEMTLELYKKK